MKHKYIVRSRHATLGTEKFIPVNKYQAAQSVLRPPIHDDGPDFRNIDHLSHQTLTESVHGKSIFKRSSPVSQDIYRALPEATLDKDCAYKHFVPPPVKMDETPNPRLAVLENFKEISRIMTQNFIQHKRLEKRYNGTVPKSELTQMKVEEEAATRMTNILKMMHSPKNFTQHQTMLPFQKVNPLDGKDRKSLMAYSTNAKIRSIANSLNRNKEDVYNSLLTSDVMASVNRSQHNATEPPFRSGR